MAVTVSRMFSFLSCLIDRCKGGWLVLKRNNFAYIHVQAVAKVQSPVLDFLPFLLDMMILGLHVEIE